MPARQPFTALCQAMARPRLAGRADLHVHTTYSDGTYTPAEVIDLARRSGLGAVAITDHDTLGGVADAEAAATGSCVEVIPGVEITSEHRGRELHLLGYFIRADDPALKSALERLRSHRVERFHEMVERLRSCGVSLGPIDRELENEAGALGRRHLARMLVKSRRASTEREAFLRYLGDNGRAAVPKVRLPVEEALNLVRGAGGVASWAHPPYDCLEAGLAELCAWGLDALEVEYPSHRARRASALRAGGARFGLAVTGGSDCHGPTPLSRTVGASSVNRQELELLRQRACR